MAVFQSSPFLRLKIIHCSIIFILFFSIGIATLTIQSVYNYRANTLERMQLSINLLDGQIERAQSAVDQMLNIATENCADSQPKILSILVEKPNIQTINIIKNDQIICSSYPQMVGKESSSAHLVGVNLFSSQYAAPGETIIIVKGQKDQLTIIATLHGFNFLGVINLLAEKVPFHIYTKQGWVNDNGILTTKLNLDTLHLHSSRTPLSISSNINYSSFAIDNLYANPFLVVLLALAALISSFYYFIYQEKRVLKSAMKKAIVRREFTPYAQAVVDHDGKISGCEILMRWQRHTKLICPDTFIPTAEETGMIIPMTLDLIDDVYQLCKKNHQFFTANFELSINICPSQLSKEHSDKLIEHCEQFSKNPDLKRINIVLEITERQIINHEQDTIDAIEKLHNIGVGISIDDFGTGYSSLENIRDFQIDGIKIDKSFIDRFPHQALSGDIIDNMLDLANRLKVPVTAEGVETQTQANYLIKRGVEHLQGYLYYKPEPFQSFLRNKKNK